VGLVWRGTNQCQPGAAAAQVEAQGKGHLGGRGLCWAWGQGQAGLPTRLAVACFRLAATVPTSSQGSWRSARPKWP